MGDDTANDLIFVAELEGLSDAHLIGQMLEEAGIEYRVAEHDAHAFDVVIPHAWGMLYVEPDRADEALSIIEDVRKDEARAEGELVEEDESDE